MTPPRRQHQITVNSPPNEQLLTYPLAIVTGRTTNNRATAITLFVSNTSATSHNPNLHKYHFPTHNGLFTAHCLLSPGINTIHLSHGEAETTTVLIYEPPPDNTPCIRLVYLKTSDGDASFQSPSYLLNTHAEALRRLETASLIIQSATAELMSLSKFPYQTFRIHPKILTHTLSDLTTKQAHSKSGYELYEIVHKSLIRQPDSNIINLAVMSFTKYENKKPFAHTALGGGQLALFGGASMFTWPSRVGDILKSFMNDTKIDTDMLFDDSAGRGTWGTCASTTIGAMLHEIGHCLSLPHPFRKAADQRSGIMGRGFDYIHRLFINVEDNDKNLPMPFWDRGSAVRLHFHPFLRLYHGDNNNQMKPSVPATIPIPIPSPSATAQNTKNDGEKIVGLSHGMKEMPDKPVFRKYGGNIVCMTKFGIGHVGYYCNGDNASHDEFLTEHPKKVILPSLTGLRNRCDPTESDVFTVSVIDAMGNITEAVYLDIK